MDISIFGTQKEIHEAVEYLNKYYTFVYDESPRFRKQSPGLPPINENTEYVADLFLVIEREEYKKLMEGK